jgi:signal transduction histidine kinase
MSHRVLSLKNIVTTGRQAIAAVRPNSAAQSGAPHLRQNRSLQFTLTLRIATLITLGLGSVTLWSSWRIQDILISSHKQTLHDTAQRVEEDIAVYRGMYPLKESIEKALNNRVGGTLWGGVKQRDGSMLLAPTRLSTAAIAEPELLRTVVQRLQTQSDPQLQQIQMLDVVVCASSLKLQQSPIGTLYLILDITTDQQQFLQLIRSLVAANIVGLIILVIAIALEARRLLAPLSTVSQMTTAISIEDLDEKRLTLDSKAPKEVQDLVMAFNRLLDRLSDAWRQQRNTAEQQRQFVSNVSHELRTPLSIVRGYVDSILRRGQNLTDAQQEALSIASIEADRTIRLMQDLLDLARADDGYLPYQPEHLILNDVAAEVAQVAGQVSQRDIQLQENDLVSAYADPQRLRQVMMNLVENAIKYSPPPSPITIQLEQSADNALIHISDLGPGIDFKHQTRIFERFYRIDESRTRSTGGTGLGLALVRTFVEGMGGSIQVKSQSGIGSTFTVTLPHRHLEEPSHAATHSHR